MITKVERGKLVESTFPHPFRNGILAISGLVLIFVNICIFTLVAHSSVCNRIAFERTQIHGGLCVCVCV